MHATILYAIAIFIIISIFIIFNKKYNLEGYIFIPNMKLYNSSTPSLPGITPNTNLTQRTCEEQCDMMNYNTTKKCGGFISNLMNDTPDMGNTGYCNFYDPTILNLENITDMTYVTDPKNPNHLYINDE
jgi:hypothetical protein